jgi:predicted DNA binding protein
MSARRQRDVFQLCDDDIPSHPTMGPRKTRAIEELETALAALRSRHSTLNERKAETQSALNQARADQQRYFLESDISDDGAIAKLENAVDAATLRLSRLTEACAALVAQIADAEQELASEAEREGRQAAAKDVTATADAIQERLESLLRDTRSLSESFVAIDHLTFEAGQFSHFLRDVAGAIEVALGVTPPQLRGLAKAVEQGEAQIPRRRA